MNCYLYHINTLVVLQGVNKNILMSFNSYATEHVLDYNCSKFYSLRSELYRLCFHLIN